MIRKITRRRLLGAAACGVAILVLAAALPRRGAAIAGPMPSLGLDLRNPDALVDTASLASMPRDLLTVPLLRDVLTQDVVTYYEQTEGRLSLGGALRRIAYEHDLDLGDWVIRTVLDEPAEVALWKSVDGRLGHALIAIDRNVVTRILELAARVGLGDSQLRRVDGDLVVDGVPVPVYALRYGARRRLVFAGHGRRLVVLSDAGMLTGSDGKIAGSARGVVAGLLGGDPAARAIYRDRFGLGPRQARHTVAVRARYLSFGYQQFFPGIDALRFDFADGGWTTGVRLAPALPAHGLRTRPAWALLPLDPCACLAVPVDWPAAATLAVSFGIDPVRMQVVADALDGPAAVCWYPKSRLHTPVFLAATSRPLAADEEAVLGALFAAVIGEPDDVAAGDGGRRWHRRAHATDVTLARHGHALVFSPDGQLVADVVAVAQKRYPAVADQLPDGSTTLVIVSAASLARLIEAETFASLPAGQEPVFRNAASTHLVPKLRALGRYPTYALVLPGEAQPRGTSWLPLEWRALPAVGTP